MNSFVTPADANSGAFDIRVVRSLVASHHLLNQILTSPLMPYGHPTLNLRQRRWNTAERRISHRWMLRVAFESIMTSLGYKGFIFDGVHMQDHIVCDSYVAETVCFVGTLNHSVAAFYY